MQMQQVTIENEAYHLIYKLNCDDFTAILTGFEKKQEICAKIIIPSSIEYDSKEYIVKSISQKALSYSFAESIEFAPDSELRIIGKKAFIFSGITKIKLLPHITTICKSAFLNCANLEQVEIPPNSELRTIEAKAFYGTPIEQITIPSSLVELKEGWCSYTQNLTKIEIDTRNPRYSCLNGQFIIGKSSEEQEEYDILVFAARNIEKVKIPEFIKVIEMSAFELCLELNQIEIPPNSKLQEIHEFAFSCTSFESITIPASLVELKEGWCSGKSKIKEIKIDQNNPRYTLLDDIFIVEKSNPQSESYDSINYARSDIKFASIPKYIKRIGDYAFNSCTKLQYVDIPDDSELQSIGIYAFCGKTIKKFFIPPQVTFVGKCAFHSCQKLLRLEIANDSKIQTFGKKVFGFSEVQSISLPTHVKRMDNNMFEHCKNFKIIEINENYDPKCLEEISQVSEITMIPVKFRDEVKSFSSDSFENY